MKFNGSEKNNSQTHNFFLVFLCSCGCLFAFSSGTRIQIIFIMLNVVKDVGQVGNHETILIGNLKIKWQRICHDVKTSNFNGHKFKWGTVLHIRSTIDITQYYIQSSKKLSNDYTYLLKICLHIQQSVITADKQAHKLLLISGI